MFQSSLARMARGAFLFASVAACTVASANESNADSSSARAQPLADDGRPHGPPPEAITACNNKTEGATCSVQFRDRTIEGTCKNGPDGNGPLACAPQHRMRPPEEAFTACAGKSEGNACSVEFHGETLDGTCRKGPGGENQLACMPNRPPGPPPR